MILFGRVAKPFAAAAVMLCLIILLAACGGGGGGSAKLTISLSPSSVTATFDQGTSYTFEQTATVEGEVSGTVYVIIRDNEGIIQVPISIRPLSEDKFLATLTTVQNLSVGRHQGIFDVLLCGDSACSQQYGKTSLAYDFTVVPEPKISSLTPSVVSAGAPNFTLTVNGTNFVSSSQVHWNGYPRATAYVSETQLTTSISQEDIAYPGTVNVSVPNRSGTSLGSTVFVIQNAELTSVAPTSVIASDAGFTLTVNGHNFIPTSTVRWGGSPLPTTYVSAEQLTAQVDSDGVLYPGTTQVSVVNRYGTGSESNVLSVSVEGPSLTTLEPASMAAGGLPFTLTVNGTNFASDATVLWNGSRRPSTRISATQVKAEISQQDIATSTTTHITVVNGASVGAGSLYFEIEKPQLASLAPSGATTGGAGFSLTVNGARFVPASVVHWNGSPRSTTYVSDTRLTATITAQDIAAGGSSNVSVINGEAVNASGSVSFAIRNPAPVLGAVDPAVVATGGSDFTITATGSAFLPVSVLRWNGSDRETTYVSPTQIKATILEADIANGGSASVTVFTPAPDGGSSGAKTVAINNPVPSLTGINASIGAAGCGDFTLYVIGAGFVPNSTVTWNGSARATTQVSASVLAAQIAASDISVAGKATVKVSSPAPGGGKSASTSFKVTDTAPATTDAPSYLINAAHTGAATTGCPMSLPAVSAWITDLGEPLSYPLIADGRVYASTGSKLYSLDPANGSTIWGPVNSDGIGASYEAGLLFQVSNVSCCGYGEMKGYDAATGALKWTSKLPGQYSFSGFTTALNGLVYVVGLGQDATIYALKQGDGSAAWTVLNQIGTSGAPSVTADGLYVAALGKAADYAPATGELIWQNSDNLTGGSNVSVTVDGDLLLAPTSGGYSGDVLNSDTGALLNTYDAERQPALKAGIGYFPKNKSLQAVDVSTSQILWTYVSTDDLYAAPVIVNETVFVGTSKGNLIAIDAASGEELWKVDLGTPDGIAYLVAGENLLLATSSKGLVAYRIVSQP